MAIWYVDYQNGSDGSAGTSFATRKQTIQGVTGASAGDTIRVMGSNAPQDVGQTASWTNQSKTVTLTSGVTSNIFLSETSWTHASTNVTASTSSTTKIGSNSSSLAIASGFTTGLAAYQTLSGGPLNFSSYNQVSFWIQTSVSVAASSLELQLCSDTVGATPVNTVVITRALNANQWTPITIDTGSALGSSIGSINLTVLLSVGTCTVLICNILACGPSSSASSITLQSLIGQNANNDTWWAIKSINGTTIVLDQHPNANAATGQGWSGTTNASAEIWKLETIKTARQTSSTASVQSPASNGSSGNPITISGGWDQSAMTTQSLITIYDGLDGFGYGFADASSKNYITLDHLGFCRYNFGMNFSSSVTGYVLNTIELLNNNASHGLEISTQTKCTLTNVLAMAGNNGAGLQVQSGNLDVTLGNVTVLSSLGQGIYLNGNINDRVIINGAVTCNNNSSGGLTISNVQVWMQTSSASLTTNYNTTYGVQFLTCYAPSILLDVTSENNTSYGVYNSSVVLGNHKIHGLTTSGNTTAAISLNGAANCSGDMYVDNWTHSDSTPVQVGGTGNDARLHSTNEAGTTNEHFVYSDGGQSTVIIQSETGGNRHTASGIAWSILPGSSNRDSFYPIRMSVAKVLILSGDTLTFTAWIMRTGTGIVNTLKIMGGVLSGIPNDVTYVGSASANTYEQATLTATPTQDGVIEIFYEAYNPSDNTHRACVDDCGINST